ncbi:MAG: DNA cytosine methyltransferase, partial [bacterium]|nr:DNA cytosine methyltransferase [bacterium]
MTLGSLFDGIGGFPLAGIKSGIRPVWASEIEPFPVRVTQKRLPDMKHYGDVSKLNGGDLEPVDIITFGSPCQDLSIAGKRNGLDGARSGLFREAIRIITEMRCKTNGRFPRWAVWENVPGALSSANGRDFREVLESLIRIKNPEADVPMPDSSKWLPAGEILGDNYSLAWRIL